MRPTGQVIQKSLGAIELKRKPDWRHEGSIVLAIIPKRGEFVTWWMSPEGETISGRYTLELNDALEDFNERN